MQICNLILAHKNPLQLQRLVKALSHPACRSFIHIDKKVAEAPFRDLLDNQPNVTFIKNRTAVHWGGFTTVLTVARAIKEIASSGVPYDYVNLLSAQDYPIKPVARFVCYLENNPDKNFIHFIKETEGGEWWQENRERFRRYHFNEFSFRGKYLVQRLVNRVMPQRRIPAHWSLYGGNCATWWTINAETATHLADRILNDRVLQQFTKFTWGIDEIVFPTIIMNAPVTTTAINNNLRYIDWSEGNAHPKTLTKNDFAALEQSEHFFARKLDMETDRELFDLIDKRLLLRDNQ
ncbi:beta-1,6-N-acetylglucosaminyltransferase [Niabella soli]|uniref:Peptide O-xylosyltransferase n=1 Tax=Niabella soli DSM 19437 TaxID=929713 RepID=W0EXA1_9BACT|nr:beta-1,6-N-acetylglucosaminyltransferase [Niabella soli]AHF14163.1 glycosyl transferase [Niabella soli DSM 19437]